MMCKFKVGLLVLVGCGGVAEAPAPCGDAAPVAVPVVDAGADAADAAEASVATCERTDVVCACTEDGRLAMVSHAPACGDYAAVAVCEFLQAHKDVICPGP